MRNSNQTFIFGFQSTLNETVLSEAHVADYITLPCNCSDGNNAMPPGDHTGATMT